MKRNLPLILILTVAAIGAGYLIAQNKSAPAAAAPAPETKRIHVASLTTVEANREFQRNVQVMQAMRQSVMQLNAELQKTTDAAKKKELQAKIEEEMKRLNDNNAKMQQAYGFSLTRNYTLEVEKAHIYMHVTEEEAARFEAAQKAKQQK